MSEEPKGVGRQYRELYADYYTGSPRMRAKREISAAQSAACLIEAIGCRKPGNLLDVGAGDGNVLAQLDAKGVAQDLYAVEISVSGVEAIRARRLRSLCDVQQFDGYRIPYPEKHFDLAIAVHVLEHVEHERLFLAELRRVARYAFIEVPLEHGFRIQRSIENGREFGHINFYTGETLHSLLQTSGLKVLDSKIVPSSLQYEQHISGSLKGLLKNFVRRSTLAAAPRVAPWLMVYNAYAYCECP
jgi:ubiquinone/menaquinone biosynthesis C-methylase UbiE